MDYDAVVVGSGFGGGVSACRLAEEGRRVCVLERGKRYPPGSFARSPREMAANFWDPSQGLHGLFDLWSFRGLEAVVASGLGGGSLIYANVLIRKDEKWFVRENPRLPGYEYWPVTYEDLERSYERAEQTIGGSPYPYHKEPYAQTPKTRAYQQAAGQLGLDWRLPNLAVEFGEPPIPGEPFGDPAGNLHGQRRFTCRLCGECDIGCNYGSKHTIDYTYLSLAARYGAEIKDRCEVRRFAPRPDGGFDVTYVTHESHHEGERIDAAGLRHTTVSCRVLVLAAGTLGTTFLLLRNRSAFPMVSHRLGSRFCGNGDLLGFITSNRVLDPSRGPVITSTARVADALDGGEGRGFYLQDGGYPQFVNWILETSTLATPVKRFARFAAATLRQRLTCEPNSQIGAQISALIGDSRLSAGAMVLLGMGRDIPDGTMRLRGGYLDIDWTTASSKSYFDRLRRCMIDVAAALDGKFLDNPSHYLSRVVTVHPLGGCPMGRDHREGVVDDHGEVFDYPGLFVADGSVMPGPVGPNPALTIAALAERFSERMIERSGHG